jgi:hypothetical protein
VSPTRRTKTKRERERYADGYGVLFDEVRHMVSPQELRQPVRRVVEDAILHQYRWFSKACPLCQRVRQLEPHHIFAAGKKSNEHSCLIPLCRECHDEIQSQPSEYRRVWRARWEWDRYTLS